MSILHNGFGSKTTGGFYPLEINQSLRFDDGSSSYLSRTPSVAGNRKTWTFSAWVKRGNLDSYQTLFSCGDSNNQANPEGGFIAITSANVLYFRERKNPTYHYQLVTNALFRDASAWYHIVVSVDTTQSTSADRVKLYVNGEQIISFSTASYPPQNYDTFINKATVHGIGADTQAGSSWTQSYLDSYLAEVHFTDGTAYTADDFGEFKSGVWVAKTPSVTYGTNGFYLKFANSGALGTDSSGNSNTWTPTNLAATDVMLDSPTNNFATFNPLDTVSSTFAEGNVKITTPTSGGGGTKATVGVSSGKWYWETLCNAISGTGVNNQFMVGILKTSTAITANPYTSTGSVFYFGTDGHKRVDAVDSTYGAVFTTGDIIGVGLDLDTGDIEFYKNGVSQGVAATGLTGEWSPCYCDGSNNVITTVTLNFGQDSSFAGAKTPQGNTDANGIGDFYYEPPTGYLALCTANLPEPAISPLNDASPSDYFNTVLYTGNGTSQSITCVGFEPDLNWTKSRNTVAGHRLYDSVRGATKELYSNDTAAEGTDVTSLISFDSDGFSVGSDGTMNGSGRTFASWNWKANGTGVSNADGSITSTVSANVDSGFSIVSYTGTGANATVGHGLSQAPDMVIHKNRSSGSTRWYTRHTGLSGATYYVDLSATDAEITASTLWDNFPTATTFDVKTNAGVNGSGNNMIAYCFHSVEGFSKIGSYTGNGSADGPFVHCGFKPAFVMIKRTDTTANWGMFDNERLGYNVRNDILYPNLSNAEGSAEWIDFTSNGFKLRFTHAQINASGGTYIFYAVAEAPAKYSTAR